MWEFERDLSEMILRHWTSESNKYLIELCTTSFFSSKFLPSSGEGERLLFSLLSFLWLSRLDIKWKCWIFSLQLLRFSPPRRRRRRRWMNKISNAKERWCSRRLRYLPFQLLAAKSVTLSKHERELRMVKIKFFKHQKGARQPPTDDDWYFVKKKKKSIKLRPWRRK